MKKRIKAVLKLILGERIIKQFRELRQIMILRYNHHIDFILFKKHSSVFSQNTFEKKESEITLRYHSLEKGFLYKPIKYRFAREKVTQLHILFKDDEVLRNTNRAHIQSAIANLINYYEIHQESNVDISSYFSKENYLFYKGILVNPLKSTKSHTFESYFSNTDGDFNQFSNSRCSVRNFTGEKIAVEKLKKVVNLANNAPSVCNRQPIKLYLVENKNLIDKIFEIQGGLKGYSSELSQMIIVSCDRSYFYSVGERNQLYIDGGIYLMNLLYALHYYQIAACPAHWGMPVGADKKMRELLKLPETLQIICLVAIGVPTDNFMTTLSLRKKSDENFQIIN